MDEQSAAGGVTRRVLLGTGAAAAVGVAGGGALGEEPASAFADQALAAWKGVGQDIRFTPADFAAMDLALHVIPELRICALAVRTARAKRLRYPLKGPEKVVELLPGRRARMAGHTITRGAVRKFLPDEFFPIRHEGELVDRIFMALMRCRAETSLTTAPGPRPAAQAGGN